MKSKSSTSNPKTSQKRKAEVTLSKDVSSGPGPILATTSGVDLPTEQAFTLYGSSRQQRQHQQVVSLETPVMHYVGSTFGESSYRDILNARYALGVYDHTTGQITVREVPIVRVQGVVKAMATSSATNDLVGLSKEETEGLGTQGEYAAARTDLGQTFGNRRKRAQISAQERGAVNVEALSSGADAIAGSIQEQSVGIPTQADIQKDVDAGRPLPAFHLDATTPEGIYDAEDLTSKQEINVMPIKDLLQAPTDKDRLSLLPFRSSIFINKRLHQACAANEKDRIARLYHLSCMLQLSLLTAHSRTVPTLRKKGLDAVPDRVFQGLIHRFFTLVHDSGEEEGKKYSLTADDRDKLINYILIQALILNDYRVIIDDFVKDLSMPKTRITEHLRSVGCTISALTVAEREALGLSASEARGSKKAQLTAPLTFPAPKFKRARK
ncbi:MAG: RNA polymerase I associated factor, A49-like protein [Piptocephalis tieghemiana]|nr:MAG: RNA polymerase I associated factor, A49-like protein [Piptocephalis tieghemiana]